MKCPLCHTETKYIVRHIVRCNNQVDQDKFKYQFKIFKENKLKKDHAERQRKYMEQQRKMNEEKVKKDQVNRKAKSRAKQREEDEEKLKKVQVNHKAKSIAKQREEDEEKVKKNQANRYAKCMAKQREEDEEKVKEDQVNRKAKSMAKQRKEDEEKVKNDQKVRARLSRRKRKAEDSPGLNAKETARQQKHRKIENEYDRLMDFKLATLHNAIFVCTCCHQRMFKSNVRLYTAELAREINTKKEEHTKDCIDELIPTKIDGKNEHYICLTCVSHMKRKKIPPMSTKNGLKLKETDTMLKDQNLNLTELEAKKNIISLLTDNSISVVMMSK